MLIWRTRSAQKLGPPRPWRVQHARIAGFQPADAAPNDPTWTVARPFLLVSSGLSVLGWEQRLRDPWQAVAGNRDQ
jgi:hypothetical protein